MGNGSVRLVRHSELSASDLRQLAALFDTEYALEYGSWMPDAPYGYAPADVHTLMFDGSALVAHVGFQTRNISVGQATVTVAGTGGVLVDEKVRNRGYARLTMDAAQRAMQAIPAIEFGYLGCREEIVPFYESVGWHRIHVTEKCLSRHDQTAMVITENAPLFICSAQKAVEEWPTGDVDLHGAPW